MRIAPVDGPRRATVPAAFSEDRPPRPTPVPTTAPTGATSKTAAGAANDPATRTPSPSPGPAVPQPVVAREAAGTLKVVDLNAAMGLGMGKGKPEGTDLNDRDLGRLVGDILDRNPDVITMQEMAKVAVDGSGGPGGPRYTNILQQLNDHEQAQGSGAAWKAYFGDSGLYRGNGPGSAPTHGARYYASDPDVPAAADPHVDSPAGNVIFVREGPGTDIRSSKAITHDGQLGDDGMRLQAPKAQQGYDATGYNALTQTNDGMTAGSVVGVELTTADGHQVDVFTTHIANVDSKGVDVDRVQAAQIDFVHKLASDRGNPAIVTGDFNTDPGRANEQPRKALERFESDHFEHANKDAGNTASEFFGIWFQQYDHVFTRGVDGSAHTFETASDHKGLVLTTPPGAIRP